MEIEITDEEKLIKYVVTQIEETKKEEEKLKKLLDKDWSEILTGIPPIYYDLIWNEGCRIAFEMMVVKLQEQYKKKKRIEFDLIEESDLNG